MPRSRRSGHTPSWTPATTTRSHSRPTAAWGVSTATDVTGRCAGDERVARHVLATDVVEEPVRAGPGQPVGEPRRRVEEREDRVEVAVGPDAGGPTGEGGVAATAAARPLASHIAHRTVSAVTPGAQRAEPVAASTASPHATPAARTRATRRAAAASGPSWARRSRREERLGEQDVARPAASRLELVPAQGPAQPPQRHGVGSADRRGEDVDGRSAGRASALRAG